MNHVVQTTRPLHFKEKLRLYTNLEDIAILDSKDFHTIVESNLFSIITWDNTNRITYANGEFLSKFGYSPEDLANGEITLEMLYGEHYPETEKGIVEELLSGTISGPTEKILTKKDGSLIDVLVSSLFLDTYKTTGISFITDITKNKLSQRALHEGQQKLNILSVGSYEATTLTDKKGKILSASPSIEKIFGYKYDELTKSNVFDLLHPADVDKIKASFAKLLNEPGSIQKVEYRIKHKDGSWRWIESVSNNLLRVPNIHAVVSNHVDITERKNAEKRIHNLAFYDQLTGLPNRALFNDRLEQGIARSKQENKKVALLLIDLDRFKNINDTLGHAVGDRILIESSQRIQSCLREADTLSRQGGDEFSIILADLDDEHEVAVTAQKVLSVLSQPFKIEKDEIYITTSIGVSIYPNDTIVPDQLLAYSDMAMYTAKKRMGGNTYSFYNAEMSKQNVEYSEIEKNLRHAILHNEFVVYYQPKLDIKTGEIIGMEALIRWDHPTMGLVRPDRFIPIAEETGLIELIGEQVLLMACKQTKKWQEKWEKPLKVAVNVSAKQLKKNFVPKVQNILEKTELNPKFLELEITETDVMVDSGIIHAILKELKNLGISISIDDFGTGYSSLSRIGNLPIDSLKIDKSFIDCLDRKKKNTAIVKAIISIAKNMNLEVIAEGVENTYQYNLLQKNRCDLIQGYLISPPVSVDDFKKLLSTPRIQVN